MGELFPNQYFGMDIWKHQALPIIESHDFNFFRCLEFKDIYYGKTVSELHRGNLRVSRKDNRYSNIFPGQKLSYWADSPKTARAEVKKWGAGNNLLTFWAYDDGNEEFYDVKWIYASKAFSIYAANTLNAGCDIDMHNFTLKNVNFEEGGITGTLNFVQIKKMNSEGTVATWANSCKLRFKNGILVEGTWSN